MPYMLTGSITYGTAANRTTAINAINNVLASFPSVVGIEVRYASGLVSTATSTLTFSFSCPDEVTANALNAAIVSAYSASARTSGHISIVKVP